MNRHAESVAYHQTAIQALAKSWCQPEHAGFPCTSCVQHASDKLDKVKPPRPQYKCSACKDRGTITYISLSTPCTCSGHAYNTSSWEDCPRCGDPKSRFERPCTACRP